MRLIRDPFVQFLLIGGLVFAVYAFLNPEDSGAVEKQIVIDAPTQQWLHSNFKKQFRRPPTPLEMGALIRRFTTNEVKYREALSMGLDDQDSIVRRRMMQKFDFLFGDAAATAVPEESTLLEWYDQNGSQFQLPPTIDLEHIWFSPDQRGESAKSDAVTALQAIHDGRFQESERDSLGDDFPFDTSFQDSTFADLRSVFGESFATAVLGSDKAADLWFGPLESGLGIHLVRILKRRAGQQPPLDQVRDLVVERWRQQESERLLAEMIIRLQGEYQVDLDEEAIMQLEFTPESESVQIGFGSDD